jgi:hypothetical protein
VVSAGDQSRILVAQNLFDALLDPLEGLPVPARRKGIPGVAVGLNTFGIPVTQPDALNQFRRDAIAFN